MTRALAFRLTGIVGCLSMLAISSCGILGPSTERFLIRVDSIAAPSVVAANDTLTARLYGKIGPDGCWRLAGIDRQANSATLDVTFHGEHVVRSGYACTAMPVALNQVEIVAPPLGSPFAIAVHQPDGSVLRRVITVQR